MSNSKNEKFKPWLQQAENDFLWANSSLKENLYSQVCFISQQIGEKSLKALAYFRGADFVKGHSILQLANEMNINGEIIRAAKKLDSYYIATRYPDFWPGNIAPFMHFEREDAETAIEFAKTIFNSVKREIADNDND